MQAKHVVPVDAIKSLLEIKNQRIRAFLLTRYKILQVSEKADVVVDRPTFDEAFLVWMDQVKDNVQVSAFDNTFTWTCTRAMGL